MCFTISLSFSSCKKEPAKLSYRNFKNEIYVSMYKNTKYIEQIQNGNKSYDDVFSECNNGVTNKPGIIIGAELNDKLGSPRAMFQFVNMKTGQVADKWEGDSNPDMTSIEFCYNLKSKGEYLINFIVKDEIVAQGTIKYE